MPNHQERNPSALARGPAKADDIERVRHETAGASAAETTHVAQAIGHMEHACQAMQDDLTELKRIVGDTRA
ncbi:MAG: hypothetical protein QOH72_671 [Solirubrobacteraceae bacterium]|jgi:hypothetical protein|nr:hypothetical protein [Solirubrobacteraceae bacterium]